MEDPWSEQNKSRIIYFDVANEFTKYLYEGEISEVSEEKLAEFISKIRSGELKHHKTQYDKEPEVETAREATAETTT